MPFEDFYSAGLYWQILFNKTDKCVSCLLTAKTFQPWLSKFQCILVEVKKYFLL